MSCLFLEWDKSIGDIALTMKFPYFQQNMQNPSPHTSNGNSRGRSSSVQQMESWGAEKPFSKILAQAGGPKAISKDMKLMGLGDEEAAPGHGQSKLENK